MCAGKNKKHHKVIVKGHTGRELRVTNIGLELNKGVKKCSGIKHKKLSQRKGKKRKKKKKENMVVSLMDTDVIFVDKRKLTANVMDDK